MTREEAELICNGAAHAHVMADKAMGVQWDIVRDNPDLFDISDDEKEEDMFEALVSTLLHGLISLCKDRGADFEELLKEARTMEAQTVEAYKLLARPLF